MASIESQFVPIRTGSMDDYRREIVRAEYTEYAELIEAVGHGQVDLFSGITAMAVFGGPAISGEDHLVFATGPQAIIDDGCADDFGDHAAQWHVQYGDPAGEMDLLRVQPGASVQDVAMIVRALLMVRAL